MTIGADGQEPQGESPTPNAAESQVESAPTQPVATGEQTTPAPSVDTSPPPVENGTSAEERARDERGRFATKESGPDPVQEAIARLTKPQAETPKAPEPSKPTEAAKPPEAKPDAKAPEQPKPALKTDPSVDELIPSKEERARWSAKTAERFDTLITRHKEARTELENLRPLAENAKEFNQILDDYGVREDVQFIPPTHLAAALSSQAAVIRAALARQQGRLPAKADLDRISALGDSVDRIRSEFGLSAPPPKTAPFTPFTGELTGDLKDLVEVYGVDEKEARIIAAVRAAGATQPPTPPAAAAPAPAVAPQAPAPALQEGVDMEALHTQSFMAELARGGSQKPSDTFNVLLVHPATKQEVLRRFPALAPEQVPAVFNRLAIETRIDIMRAAHRSLAKAVPVPAPSTPPPPPTSSRSVPRTTTRAEVPSLTGKDPVKDALAYLGR